MDILARLRSRRCSSARPRVSSCGQMSGRSEGSDVGGSLWKRARTSYGSRESRVSVGVSLCCFCVSVCVSCLGRKEGGGEQFMSSPKDPNSFRGVVWHWALRGRMARGHRNTTPRSEGPGCSGSATTTDHSITIALTVIGPRTVLAGKQKIQLPRTNR